MSSICMQTLKDLAIPFSTLPYGDKNDDTHAKKTCQLWIETAISTTIVAGFFFADFVILEGSRFAFNYIAHILDPTVGSIHFLNFIFNNGFLYIIPMFYSRYDSHATVLCCFAENIYLGFQSYRSRNYLFLGINALYATQKLKPRENNHLIQHWGKWRQPIQRFANSWAPTMAT